MDTGASAREKSRSSQEILVREDLVSVLETAVVGETAETRKARQDTDRPHGRQWNSEIHAGRYDGE